MHSGLLQGAVCAYGATGSVHRATKWWVTWLHLHVYCVSTSSLLSNWKEDDWVVPWEAALRPFKFRFLFGKPATSHSGLIYSTEKFMEMPGLLSFGSVALKHVRIQNNFFHWRGPTNCNFIRLFWRRVGGKRLSKSKPQAHIRGRLLPAFPVRLEKAKHIGTRLTSAG